MDKQMTLAEAIKLGSLHMEPVGGDFHSHDWTKGCALGMAMFAHGQITQTELRKRHPVLNQKTSTVTSWICRSSMPDAFWKDFFWEITHKFDTKVDVRNGMTLDQLCDEIELREKNYEAARAQRAARKAAELQPEPTKEALCLKSK